MYQIPDRWLEYSRCGEVIDDTGILASKTPLKNGFHKCKQRPEGVPPSEEFTPTQLIDYCEKRGQRIGLVVDLTFTNRYYDPKELSSFGVQHVKIKCPGHEIPDQGVYENFADVLEHHLTLDDPGVIVVHCTHGVNRTGYLVCKFLIDHFKYTADNAIRAFNEARGHPIERENYISAIQEYWLCLQGGGGVNKMLPGATSLSPRQPYRDNWELEPWDYYSDMTAFYDDYDYYQDYCDDYGNLQSHTWSRGRSKYQQHRGTSSRGRGSFYQRGRASSGRSDFHPQGGSNYQGEGASFRGRGSFYQRGGASYQGEGTSFKGRGSFYQRGGARSDFHPQGGSNYQGEGASFRGRGSFYQREGGTSSKGRTNYQHRGAGSFYQRGKTSSKGRQHKGASPRAKRASYEGKSDFHHRGGFQGHQQYDRSTPHYRGDTQHIPGPDH